MSLSVVRSAQIAVGLTAVRIAVGNSGGSIIGLHQQGNSNHAIYLGGEGVTISNGYLMHKGEHVEVTLPEGVALYAVADTTETLFVLQTGGR